MTALAPPSHGSKVSTSHLVRFRPPQPSPGYEIYWRFAAARQLRYRERLGVPAFGARPTGADEAVLARHRFTNAYRASDRVSQYLLVNVIYDRPRPWRDVFARVLLFKLFNRIETWEYLQQHLGDIDANVVLGTSIEDRLAELVQRRPVYSAAYIMPPPMDRSGPKYLRHVNLLRDMLRGGLHERVVDAPDLSSIYHLLAAHQGIGPFLAYQYATDLNYADALGHDESTFVVAGPGASRGLRKCFLSPGDYGEADLIRWVADQQHEAFVALDLPWHDLWGRPLQLIDAQNLFCEVDKYTRAANPELARYAAGSRIKQLYRRLPESLSAWFPPRWGINERATAALRLRTCDGVTQPDQQSLFSL
jgi:hypothetical protein